MFALIYSSWKFVLIVSVYKSTRFTKKQRSSISIIICFTILVKTVAHTHCPGRPQNRWLDQLCRDNSTPPADLWRRAVTRRHSGWWRYGFWRLRVNDDDEYSLHK